MHPFLRNTPRTKPIKIGIALAQLDYDWSYAQHAHSIILALTSLSNPFTVLDAYTTTVWGD